MRAPKLKEWGGHRFQRRGGSFGGYVCVDCEWEALVSARSMSLYALDRKDQCKAPRAVMLKMAEAVA